MKVREPNIILHQFVALGLPLCSDCIKLTQNTVTVLGVIDEVNDGARLTSCQTASGTSTEPKSSRRRSSCRSADRQIRGEASLITTAVVEILRDFLRAIMHRDLALGQD